MYPLVFSRTKSDIDDSKYDDYGHTVHLKYNKRKDSFFNRLNETSSYKLIKPLKQYFLKGVPQDLFMRFKKKSFNIDVLTIGANQIHIIDKENRKIAHFLIPDANSDWFFNDIETQKIIKNYTIKIPALININESVPYFITDYIEGESFSELSFRTFNEINIELFQFYSEQRTLIKKNIKSEFELKINLLFKNIDKYDTKGAASFKKSLLILIDKINIEDICLRNNYIFYLNIVHGDMNYRENIVKSSDKSLYFIDWEMSRSANLLYDYFYMLMHDVSNNESINNSLLLRSINNSSQNLFLSDLINKSFDINFNVDQLRDYFSLSLLDMMLYKILIIEEKRISKLFLGEIDQRFNSLNILTIKLKRIMEMWDYEKLNKKNIL